MASARVEHCVTTPACAALGVAAGAARLELCSALEVGGLTPSPGLMAEVCALPCPTRVMIRPRSGGFTFDAAEARAMEADIVSARRAGAEGIVIGAEREGALDVPLMARLVAVADGMGVTLHRVVDLLPDPLAAVETAAELGIDCILMSAADPEALTRMARHAAGRVEIMAGGGVTPARMGALTATGVDWLHGSFSLPTPAPLGAPPSPRASAELLHQGLAA